MGVSLPEPVSEPNLWALLPPKGLIDVRADIAGSGWQAAARHFDPEVVVHLAAQSLVPRGYLEPGKTFASNVMGTVQVLEAMPSFQSLVATLFATTDKVYDTRQPTPFIEGAFIGGHDPYSASKACAELVIQSWPSERALGTARAGNVIGGGDWAADRLLPDLERAWSTQAEVALRRPDAVRPWQHVLEPLRGYLLYVEHLAQHSTRVPALNFGPSLDQCIAVGELVEHAADGWERLTGSKPAWSRLHEPNIHETDLLELDSTLAHEQLGWRNVMTWRDSVNATLAWQAGRRDGRSAADLVSRQLEEYVQMVELAG